MATNTLVAYYSMSGNTRAIANEIGGAIAADIEEIREPHARHGFSGVLRALADSMLRRKPTILPADRDPAQYDLLVIGGPVWSGRMAAPVRTYAERYGTKAPQVAFFCTEGGRGGEAAFADLQRLCMHAPTATFIVDAKHLESNAHRAQLGHFTSCMSRATHAAPG